LKKINLHTHTNYSDGSSTIASYCRKAIELQHEALVITDHDYMNMSVQKFKEEIKEAYEVSKEYDFPIIVGLEISLWHHEALLFSQDACIDWLTNRQLRFTVRGDVIDSSIKDPSYIKEIRDKYNCALILCHPICNSEYTSKMSDLYPIIDGYEIRNSGMDWSEESITWLESVMPNAKQYKNYDAHIVDHFSGVCNEINIEIKNENDLINWVKGGIKNE
jgi:hypothetical protein